MAYGSGIWDHVKSRYAGTVGRFKLTPEQTKQFLVSVAIAFAGGLLFYFINAPLPWLLGPLTCSLIAGVAGYPLYRPKALQTPLRTLLGVAIGASFTPALLGKMGGLAGSLLLMIPYMLIISMFGMLFLERVAGFDRRTAFFSTAPGGLTDMTIMAMDCNADVRRVALVQASRVLMMVFILPFWLQYVGGLPLGGATMRTPHIYEVGFADFFVIVLIAWGGWKTASKIGLLAPAMIGPLIMSGIAHSTGLTTVKVPFELLVIAQLIIGMGLGSSFSGITLREFVTILSWGMAFATVLVLLSAAMALIASKLTGIDSTTLLLSYAPGGQNEMAIMAIVLGIDAAIIAIHHLLRVAMVVVTAQFVFKMNKSWHVKPADATIEPPKNSG